MFFICLMIADDDESVKKFEYIFNSFGKQMLYVANSVLHNKQDAEDAVQDALIRIASHLDEIETKDEARLRAYLLTSAKNAARDQLKRKAARAKTFNIDDFHDLSGEEIDSGGYEEILDCIRSMDPIYRDVLYYRFVEEMPEKEIASLLGKKYGTVKMQIKRGRALLIKAIKEKEEKDNG